MTPARFRWLLPRLRNFYLHNPWAVDRWLEESAVECDEVQWQALCRLLDRQRDRTKNNLLERGDK